MNCHFICEFNYAVAMPRIGLFALYDRTLVFCCWEIGIMEGLSWKELLSNEDKRSYEAQIQMFCFVFYPVHLLCGCIRVFQFQHLVEWLWFGVWGFGIKFHYRALCWAFLSVESHVGAFLTLLTYCCLYCIWFRSIWMN